MSEKTPEQKAKKAAYDKIYYAARRDGLRTNHRAYYAANRGKIAKSPEQKAKKAAYQKAYCAAHREELNTKKLAYAAEHRRESRERELKRRYGLGQAEVEARIEKQGGGCAICGKKNWNGYGPVVDHEHIPNGKVRGILCTNCNTALGLIHDDPDIARRVENYLRHGGINE